MGYLLEIYTGDSIQHHVGSEALLPAGKTDWSNVCGTYGQCTMVLMGAGRAVGTSSTHANVTILPFLYQSLCSSITLPA